MQEGQQKAKARHKPLPGREENHSMQIVSKARIACLLP